MLVSVHILHCASIIFLRVRVPMSNSCIVKPVVFEVIKMNAHYIELLIKAHLTPSMCLRENLYKISFTFIALRESKLLTNLSKR